MSVECEIEISVVIPCWNVERWVARCLDEVFAALPAKAEVIAVDDGSADRTLSILRARAEAEPRLIVIAAPHAGVSAARNRALDRARGEFVFFVDPDDGVDPAFFSVMTRALRETGADYCLCAYAHRSEDGVFTSVDRLRAEYEFRSNDEIVRGYLPRIFGYSFEDVRRWYAGTPLFSGREMAGVWRGAFRRELIERYAIRFDESVVLYEDAMFNAAYLLKAGSMTSVDRPLYRCTDRASGAMRTVPRDGCRLCRNKLQLLRCRETLDRDGRLLPLYEASCVFSLLEILAVIAKRRIPLREGLDILREMMAKERVRSALRRFPLSFRRPFYALSILFLRFLCP